MADERRADTEARFIAAIQRDPHDEGARLVYADWLEEQDDVRAEYLRLENQLWSIPQRLRTLHGQIDATWLEAVGRVVDIHLIASPNKIQTIKLIREINGIGLREAKDLVDAAPVTVKTKLAPHEAKALVRRFAEHGAIVEIRRGSAIPAAVPDSVPHPGDVSVQTANLVLVRVGPLEELEERRNALRAIRTITGVGLSDAQNLLRGAVPVVLREGLPIVEANELRSRFAALDIDLEVVSTSLR